MGSNYTLIIRLFLCALLILLGVNQFVHFSETLGFTGELIGLQAGDLFYGAMFIVSGALILFRKAMPIALIILLFFSIQVLFHHFSTNPKNILSPLGLVALLVMLNILDNKRRFTQLFY